MQGEQKMFFFNDSRRKRAKMTITGVTHDFSK